MRFPAALPLCVVSCLLLPACAPLGLSRHRTLKVELPASPDPKAVRAADELLEEAEEALDCGQLDKAQARLEEAIRLNPALGPAYNNLGLLHFEQRQLYEAANAFNTAIGLMPGSGVPHNNLGLTLEAGGRHAEALVHFEEAYSLDPGNAEFLGNLARARIASGDISDDSIALLKEVVFLDSRPEWIAWAEEELALHIPRERSEVVRVHLEQPDDSGAEAVDDDPRPLIPPLPVGESAPLLLPALPVSEDDGSLVSPPPHVGPVDGALPTAPTERPPPLPEAAGSSRPVPDESVDGDTRSSAPDNDPTL